MRAVNEKLVGEIRTLAAKSDGAWRLDIAKSKVWWFLMAAALLGFIGRALHWF